MALLMIKHGDNAQHQSDVNAIAGYSNQLDSAQTDLAVCNGKLLALSNSFSLCQSVSLAFSNQLIQAQSAAALDADQITNLNRQIIEAKMENLDLSQRALDLTNQISRLLQQMTALTGKIAVAESNLNRANNDYALLEDRLRQDVAERLVVERKFNNLSELQTQMETLKKNPAREISAEGIYAGLDVEVKSNAFHVISRIDPRLGQSHCEKVAGNTKRITPKNNCKRTKSV